MSNSRVRNTSLTASAGLFRALLSLVSIFISRTIFVYILGAQYLSINGLFTNILSILSLAELGVGSAINFYLYKPIAEKDYERLKMLMKLYKTCYRFVGIFIITIGSALMPILDKLVNFDVDIDVNLYLVYFLFLLNTGCSYLLNAYKQAFLQANQMGYKLENINSLFVILNLIADASVLIVFRRYVLYLVVKLILVFAKNLLIGIYVDKVFPFLKGKASRIKKEEIRIIFKDISNVLVFNIGDRLINSTDNIIISVMLGTISVGYYSNYFLIITQVKSFYCLIIDSFRAGIGDAIAKKDVDKFSLYKEVALINQILSMTIAVGLCQVFNSVVNMWLGRIDSSYVLPQSVVVMICLSLYYDMSTSAINLFRETNGNFRTGRFTAIVVGVVNIVLSVLFAWKFGLVGVFLATVVSKFAVGGIMFIYSIGNTVFDNKGKILVIEYYINLLLTIAMMVGAWFLCGKFHMKGITDSIVEIVICGVYIVFILIIVNFRKQEYKVVKNRIIIIMKKMKDKILAK